uniref:Uncharacterized protein n=1 Tax=Aegilops tauschii TaxID=37682 RepID=M8C7V9_AEGTA
MGGVQGVQEEDGVPEPGHDGEMGLKLLLQRGQCHVRRAVPGPEHGVDVRGSGADGQGRELQGGGGAAGRRRRAAAGHLQPTRRAAAAREAVRSRSAPLPRKKARAPEEEEDAASGGSRRRPRKHAHADNAATTDWRALDKFVASQLSPGGECAALEATAATTAAAVAGASSQAQAQLDRDEDDMAALLFLNSDGRDEMERWTGLLGSAGAGVDSDLGICVFDK